MPHKNRTRVIERISEWKIPYTDEYSNKCYILKNRLPKVLRDNIQRTC